MTLNRLRNSLIILFVGVVISLSLVQISYGSSLGRVIAVAGGKIILEFVGGFANKMGQEAAERLILEYPPPSPQQRSSYYKGPLGGYLSYEFVGWQGGSPVYRTKASDDFIRNLKKHDDEMDAFIRGLRQQRLIPPEQERELLRQRQYLPY